MTPLAPAPARIVLAEDDPDVSATTIDLLTLGGHTVAAFASGREALDHLTHHAADLLLTDMIMPGGDGPWLLHQVRGVAGLGHLPVLVVSARADESHVAEGLRNGADAYLTKPFDPERLLETVAYWVEQGRARRSARPA
jgi:CheY-like chemotaxis protein